MNADLYMMVALALLVGRPLLRKETPNLPKWYRGVAALVTAALLIAPIIAALKWVGGLIGVGGA